MVAALSSMFRQAVKRGKMPFNPCLGMDKAHKADPNAKDSFYGATAITWASAHGYAEIIKALLDAEHEVVQVVTQADKPAGRGKKMTATAIAQFAESHRLTVLKTTDINAETFSPQCDGAEA